MIIRIRFDVPGTTATAEPTLFDVPRGHGVPTLPPPDRATTSPRRFYFFESFNSGGFVSVPGKAFAADEGSASTASGLAVFTGKPLK